MSDLKNIKEKFVTRLNENLNLDEINKIKSELFGKNGLISSQFKNISSISEIDRKILAEIAYDSPEAFKKIVQKAQSALN